LTQGAVRTEGPRGFVVGDPVLGRKWSKSTLRVRWSGDVPKFLTRLEVGQLVTEAFAAWSVSAVPASGLRFTFGDPVKQEFRSSADLLKLNFGAPSINADILVVFTDHFDDLVPRREGRPPRIGVSLEQREPPGAIGHTFIVFDNRNLETRAGVFWGLLHEAGHALGLAHSAVDWPGLIVTGLNRPPVPVMAPSGTRQRLHVDDVAAVSDLYRSPPFATQYGWIEGRVVDANYLSRPINGVQVIAVPVASSAAASPTAQTGDRIAYGALTPFGDPDSPEAHGRFRFAVPPGRYLLQARSVPLPFDDTTKVSFCAVTETKDQRELIVEAGKVSPVGNFPAIVRLPPLSFLLPGPTGSLRCGN